MNNRTQSTAAFSLAEVTIALGVAAFCLIAILGLMPAGLKTNQASVRQTTANGILAAIVADLRAIPVTTPPGGSTTSSQSQFGIKFQQNKTLYFAADGRAVAQTDPNAIFYATVAFSSSGGGPGAGDSDEDEGGASSSKTASFAYVTVGWPPAAGAAAGGHSADEDDGKDEDDGGSGASAVQPTGVVATFVGLDRN